MILCGNELVSKIRNEFDNAKNRIWIAVPFIGEWNAVKRIMGTKWITNNQLNIKIITDIRNQDFIDSETIKRFLHRANVKTLAGLHAKIYIIDNSVFITSANLTGTAFSRRYEICEYFKISPSHKIISVFNDWWQISKEVKTDWKPKKKKSGKSENEAGNILGLKKLWQLPNTLSKNKEFNDYQDKLTYYNHFKELYIFHVNRIFPKLPIYQEIDSFFNFLFHEHPNIPSHKFYKEKYRVITEKQRLKDLKKYHKEFHIWVINNRITENYRIDNINLIHKKLSLKNINKINRNDLEEITKCFHCMNSMPINRTRFLNPLNNELKEIKKKFKILLHDNTFDLIERMKQAKMIGFGKSAVQELLSLYFPEKHPVVNSNSNSGLKFFGYDIRTY